MTEFLDVLALEAQNPRSWIEIVVLTILFFLTLTFIRGTQGAFILKGMVFFFVVAFVGIMLVATALQLDRLKQLFSFLLSISFIALIVIFAPEMRRGLSRLAQWNVLTPTRGGMTEAVIEEIVDACYEMGRRRIGALITIEREARFDVQQLQGIRQDAAVTSRLLQTIFFTGSPLHDGSVIVRDGRIVGAGCQLPMPDSTRFPRELGMRHRAAMGVTEESDAVALVVSEEMGRVSMAVQGRITLGIDDRKDLRDQLVKLLVPEAEAPTWWQGVLRTTRRHKDSARRSPAPETERAKSPRTEEKKT
jgi:diadenylate cyclase